MDRKYIDMHLLVDKYIQGVLDDDELAQFEERVVWDQELQADLELTEQLREGMRAVVASEEYSTEPASRSLRTRFSAWFATPRYAAAASFLLAVAVTSGVLLNPITNGGTGTATNGELIEIVPLIVVRGSETPDVAFSESKRTILLVDVIGDYQSYRASVRSVAQVETILWSQEGLQPTYPNSLAIDVPYRVLAAGPHILRLEGSGHRDSPGSDYEIVQDIAFEAVFARQ